MQRPLLLCLLRHLRDEMMALVRRFFILQKSVRTTCVVITGEVPSKHGARTYHMRSTHVLSAPSVEQVTVEMFLKTHGVRALCAH